MTRLVNSLCPQNDDKGPPNCVFVEPRDWNGAYVLSTHSQGFHVHIHHVTSRPVTKTLRHTKKVMSASGKHDNLLRGKLKLSTP